ncbi:hypothetical protein WDZ17_02080 [Pseudokineococcus basanitobsidens]|uniref:PGAP1-like protein n=1 Tax=Pseudokineococcus basanitobsidens TaxID=1926649 RepID=A0ABU8RG83_9ACTN
MTGEASAAPGGRGAGALLPGALDEVLGAGREAGGGLRVRGGAGGLVVEGTAMQDAARSLARTGEGLLVVTAATATAGAAGGPAAAVLDPAGAAGVQQATVVALARLARTATGCARLSALLTAAGLAYAHAEEVAARAGDGARDAVARAAGGAVGGLVRSPEVVVPGAAAVLAAVTAGGLVWVAVRGGGLVGEVGDDLVADLADGRLDVRERGLVADAVRDVPVRLEALAGADLAAAGASAAAGLSGAAAQHPLLLEALVGGLPVGLAAAVGVAGGPTARRAVRADLPGGDRLVWPPADVADLSAAVSVLATQDGALRPTRVRVRPAGPPAAVAPATGVADLLARAAPLAGGGALSPGGRGRSAAPVLVEGVVDAAGTRRWVLVLPPTQTTADPRSSATTNPADLGSDLRAVGHVPSAASRAAVRALEEAGARPGDPLLLVGYSQGGIVAAQLAADPHLRSVARVDAVLTAGAPSGGYDVPDDVAVLSLEHEEDWIHRLDGERSPATPGRTTVSRDLTDAGDLTGADLRRDGMSGHDLSRYTETAALVDASEDPSLVAWRERVAPYLDAEGTTATRQTFLAERVPAG